MIIRLLKKFFKPDERLPDLKNEPIHVFSDIIPEYSKKNPVNLQKQKKILIINGRHSYPFCTFKFLIKGDGL